MTKIHSNLTSDLWKDEKLIPKIRDRLLQIATVFYKTLKVKTSPVDITLTGSSANFNYTPNSDIDLHIIVDFKKINCEFNFTKEYFLNKKSLWNDEHNITIRGKDVELYVQDISEPHKSTGVYSVLNDKWITKPSIKNFYLQDTRQEEVLHKFNHIKDLIDHNITHNTNPNFLKKIKKKITNMRKEGLIRSGETDINNLVFKELRNKKYIDKLTRAITQNIDKKLSIETFAMYCHEKV